MYKNYFKTCKYYLLGLILVLFFSWCEAAVVCDFEAVKKEIDQVTNSQLMIGQDFRRKVREGWDSVKVLTDLASGEMRKPIDICRYEVIEYLTKIGFPPAH